MAFSIREIAEKINELSRSRLIGKLQEIRVNCKGGTNTNKIFSMKTIKEEGEGSYAFHHGGRTELQFNIGEDNGGFRYGIAFSLDRDRSLLNPVEELRPKIKKFNDLLKSKQFIDVFSDLKMWVRKNKKREPERPVHEIPNEWIKEDTFIFIGKWQEKFPESEEDIEQILDLFDKLLPVYIEIECSENDKIKSIYKEIYKIYIENCLQQENLKIELYIGNSFYNSLKTKGFVILAGLSGTGKTKIFEEFVKCFPHSEYEGKKWVVIKETGEKLFPIYKEKIEFNNGKIKIEEFIDSINDALHEETQRRVYLKLGSYYAEVVPVVENLKKKTSLIGAEGINNLLAVYIASLFGFEIVEKEDIERLNLKRLNKKLELKRFSRKENSLFFPIRPDYKDSKSLLGFYNPINNKYHSTPLLDFILDAIDNYLEKGKNADPFFVLFDEMNLARVEYYFADFLSILEAKRFESKEEALGNYRFYYNFLKKLRKELTDENYRFTSQSIKLHNQEDLTIPQEIFLPPNLYFVGTVNIDETTHMFSPKVLDRAFTIEFDVGSFESYVEFLKDKYGNNTTKENNKNREIPDNIKRIIKEDFTNNGEFAFINKEKITEFVTNEVNNKYKEKLEEINRVLKPYNLHFGYRVFDEIIMFLYNCQNSLFKFDNLDEAFDLAIKMKVLPKFHGTRQKLEEPIKELLKALDIKDINLNQDSIKLKGIPIVEGGTLKVEFMDGNQELRVKRISTPYIHTVHKLLEMLYKVQTEGFASFM